MPESLIDFLAREYEYLRGREGRDFFLALAPYNQALRGKRRIRRALKRLTKESREAAKRFVAEENELIAEARRIRNELAERAPEIDNSDVARPDPASHDYGPWVYDSFAGFDDLIRRDATLQIGYPVVPDNDDPGVSGTLLQILRGRHRTAVYGEHAPPNAPKIRDDLDDLGTRLGNLGRKREHALTRYRQESRTLPGLAAERLVYFGSDLNPEPAIIETDEDVHRWMDRSLREWGRPKTIVRQLVNGERMEQWERDSAAKTDEFLKGELDRLHQELTRHAAPGLLSSTIAYLREPVVGIAVGLIVLALAVYFGLDDGDSSSPPTVTVTTTGP